MFFWNKTKKEDLKVLFVSSEAAPIAKVGGLGDVAGSLPKALKELGCDVRVMIPKYGCLEEGKYTFGTVAKGISVGIGKGAVDIRQTVLPGSDVPVYLLENKKFFSENHIYFDRGGFVNSFKEIERFLFFSSAVIESFQYLEWFPHIIHCNDWHTSIIPLLLKIKGREKFPRTLLTIHNLANQGRWKAEEIFQFFGWKGKENRNLKLRDLQGNFNIFQQGIAAADFLNTVSPNYAKEILTLDFSEGMEKWLKKRQGKIYGFLNGIDESVFNPSVDDDIAAKYSYLSIDNKKQNKLDLQRTAGFGENPNAPFLGLISRLTSQKGIDFLIKALPGLASQGCQIIILGVGADEYQKSLLEISRQYPKNVSVNLKFDAILAQKIYAGCDIFLMPSRFEPCGLGQMISQKYGTIPIVSKIGGLADTVKDRETGFVFKEYSFRAFIEKLKEALDCYKNKEVWLKIIKKAMEKDNSWAASAEKYLSLYQKIVEG